MKINNQKHDEQKKGEISKFKPGEIKHLVFAALGISIVISGTVLVTPNFPIVVGSILKIIEELKHIKIPKSKLKRTLQQLEKKKLITLEKEKDQVVVKILEAGKVNVFKYSLKSILDFKKKEKKWDGRWFLVIFDVPEKERNKRDYLRRFLADIGFYPYQQSVYVFPYECHKEVFLLKKIVEGGKYISYIVAESLEYEDKLKDVFDIKV